MIARSPSPASFSRRSRRAAFASGGSGLRGALGALLPVVLLAGCASQHSPAATPAPTSATPRVGVVRRDVFVPVGPVQSSRNIRDFAIAPWSAEGGECRPVRVTPTGAEYESVYYPNLEHAGVLIALTLDSTGHIIHSSETHGVIRFRPPKGDTTRAGLDSALARAQRATRVTTISLDYVTDNGFLVQRGGGEPARSMVVSTVAVQHLQLLDNPAQHARDAARHCRVGIYGEPGAGTAARPTNAQGSRTLMTPEDVARAFYDDLRQREWTRAAALMDLPDAGQFRLLVLRNLVGWAMKGSPTFAKERAAGSRLGIGWGAARDTALLPRYDTVSVITAHDSTTIGALAHLPPDTLVARMLASTYGDYGNMTVPIFIGYVTEGDSLAHVVYRTGYVGGLYTPPATQRTLVHLRRVGGSWKLILGEPVLSASAIVNAAIQYPPPSFRRPH